MVTLRYCWVSKSQLFFVKITRLRKPLAKSKRRAKSNKVASRQEYETAVKAVGDQVQSRRQSLIAHRTCLAAQSMTA